MTPSHPEASAHAPWMSTIVGFFAPVPAAAATTGPS